MAEQIIAKYIRLSIDDALSDSLSIENQRLLLDQYILDSDMTGPVREFVDNGYSGINFERPGIQELLELVREGRVRCILVKDFSRFGRDALETGYFIERVFPLYRVRFVSVSDGFDSAAHDGDTGGMEVAFKFLINEYYSRDLSRKISSAKREKARRGEAVTKNCAFGYMLDDERKMVIDPGAAETVKIIFEMYSAGKGLIDIERRLYDENRPTPAAWKKHRWKAAQNEEFRCVWQKSVILSILQDEQYTGTYVAGKSKTVEVGSRNRASNDKADWIRISDQHPAIVSQEVFDMVQERIGVRGEPLRKRKVGTAERYASVSSPLKGKLVCGHCEHTLRLSSTKNAAFHCWFTRSAPDTACHGLRILGREIEEVVRESVIRQAQAVLLSAEEENSVAVRRVSSGQSECGQRIEALQNEKQRLYESMVLGEVSHDKYKSAKAAVDAELAVQQQLYTVLCEQNVKSAPNAASVKAARAALDVGALTSELVQMLIDKVLLFPDNRIEIVWAIAGFANSLQDAV